MAHVLSGLYSLDGKDLWDAFNIGIESGTEAFLQFPEVKDRVTEDWADENGIDIDLATPFYVKSRDIAVNFFIVTDSETNFWTNWLAFKALLLSSGLHLFHIDRFGRSFGVVYKSASNISLSNKTFADGGKIKFTVTFTELNPAYVNEYARLIDSLDNNLTDSDSNYFQIIETKTN